MINFLVSLAAFSATLAAYVIAYRRGRKDGIREALSQMTSDLDTTIVEWQRRAGTGDVARSLELPGLTAFRRMLGK